MGNQVSTQSTTFNSPVKQPVGNEWLKGPVGVPVGGGRRMRGKTMKKKSSKHSKRKTSHKRK